MLRYIFMLAIAAFVGAAMGAVFFEVLRFGYHMVKATCV